MKRSIYLAVVLTMLAVGGVAQAQPSGHGLDAEREVDVDSLADLKLGAFVSDRLHALEGRGDVVVAGGHGLGDIEPGVTRENGTRGAVVFVDDRDRRVRSDRSC